VVVVGERGPGLGMKEAGKKKTELRRRTLG
jgi:hypothetical protein